MSRYLHLTFASLALVGLIDAAHAVNIDINVGTPAPVYVAPPPVYVVPPPQVAVVPGWHGDRYYDGHRYWARRDWEAHERYDEEHHRHHDDDHYHCPPGHAKKGEC